MADKTFFASPEREEKEEALAESRELASRLDLRLVMKAVPECAAVLNDCRQVLLANQPLDARQRAEATRADVDRNSTRHRHLAAKMIATAANPCHYGGGQVQSTISLPMTALGSAPQPPVASVW